jgi:hypothetical protein
MKPTTWVVLVSGDDGRPPFERQEFNTPDEAAAEALKHGERVRVISPAGSQYAGSKHLAGAIKTGTLYERDRE